VRALRLAILPLLVATSLAAQAPAPSAAGTARVSAVAPRRTAFFDFAALVDRRQRFGLEPLVFGRWTVGLIGTHTSATTAAQPQVIAYAPPNPLADPIPPTLCPVQGCPPPYPGPASSYNAWSLDLAVRYYPAALAFDEASHRFTVYLGEFIGYHRRTIRQTTYVVPLGATPSGLLDTTVVPPPAPYDAGTALRLTGWEPGAEIGVRLVPLKPVFIDVGGWFKLVAIDDPTQRIRPGQVDARLVAAVGIGW
jgi:hypothetical protein